MAARLAQYFSTPIPFFLSLGIPELLEYRDIAQRMNKEIEAQHG